MLGELLQRHENQRQLVEKNIDVLKGSGKKKTKKQENPKVSASSRFTVLLNFVCDVMAM